MSNAEFRFLHVSDLHLCIEPRRTNLLSLFSTNRQRIFDVAGSLSARSVFRPTSYEPDSLDALSQFVLKRARSYHGILLSGDLATSGSYQDLRTAGEYLKNTPNKKWSASGSPVFPKGTKPMLLIPGNHDHYSDDFARPSKIEFRLQFGPEIAWLNKYDTGYRLFNNGSAVIAVVSSDMTFNSVNEPENLPHRFGGGFANENGLSEMVRLTRSFFKNPQFENTSCGVVWMLHFAPHQCEPKSLEMTNWELVLDAAASAGVKNIVCGHTHESNFRVERGINIFCAGSATSVACQNSVHEIVFDVASGGIHRENYVYDPYNTYRFIRANGSPAHGFVPRSDGPDVPPS